MQKNDDNDEFPAPTTTVQIILNNIGYIWVLKYLGQNFKLILWTSKFEVALWFAGALGLDIWLTESAI